MGVVAHGITDPVFSMYRCVDAAWLNGIPIATNLAPQSRITLDIRSDHYFKCPYNDSSNPAMLRGQ